MSILEISISPSNIIIPAISRLQGCLYSQIQHGAEVSMFKLATSSYVKVIASYHNHQGFITENHQIMRAQPEEEVWFSVKYPW